MTSNEMSNLEQQAAALDAAVRLAAEKHSGQRDKMGHPYLLHVISVMSGVDGIIEKQAAVLHDIIEDTDATAETLQEAGIDATAIEAIKLLTHTTEDSYSEYVVRLKEHPVARAVKLSDLRHNMQLDRVILRQESPERDSNRIQRYILTAKFLNDQISESEYRSRMQNVDAGPQQ